MIRDEEKDFTLHAVCKGELFDRGWKAWELMEHDKGEYYYRRVITIALTPPVRPLPRISLVKHPAAHDIKVENDLANTQLSQWEAHTRSILQALEIPADALKMERGAVRHGRGDTMSFYVDIRKDLFDAHIKPQLNARDGGTLVPGAQIRKLAEQPSARIWSLFEGPLPWRQTPGSEQCRLRISKETMLEQGLLPTQVFPAIKKLFHDLKFGNHFVIKDDQLDTITITILRKDYETLQSMKPANIQATYRG